MTLSAKNDYIFVGLGNPGTRYENTRHNIGYLILQRLAEKRGWRFKEDKRFNAYWTKGDDEGSTLHLLLPTTYMNLSGVALKRYLDFFKLDIKRVIVIVDDIALPFGQMRLREKGSSGGHNGLKSIESELNTKEFARLRVGIGAPESIPLADYVLAPFSAEETQELKNVIERGADILSQFSQENLVKIMQMINSTPYKKVDSSTS